jgi:hypothetical protein
MLLGFLCYRSQIGFPTGWIHHVVYIGFWKIAVRCGWAHIFCLAAVMEVRFRVLIVLFWWEEDGASAPGACCGVHIYSRRVRAPRGRGACTRVRARPTLEFVTVHVALLGDFSGRGFRSAHDVDVDVDAAARRAPYPVV